VLDAGSTCALIRQGRSMSEERGDGYSHPFIQWQCGQESFEFRPAAGAIEAQDTRLGIADGHLPQPHEATFVSQLLSRNCFGSLPFFDLGLGDFARNSQLELDEKLHRLISC
jgi:hypothetical protein